jgi:hypothetical protein
MSSAGNLAKISGGEIAPGSLPFENLTLNLEGELWQRS